MSTPNAESSQALSPSDAVLREMAKTRLNRRMIRIRNNARSTPVDFLSVQTEALRMFPGLATKDWFKSFLAQFCLDRGVAVPKGELDGAGPVA